MPAKRPLVLDNQGFHQLIQANDYIDITNGGTGAITAAGARTSLGLAIGSQVQAWGAGLDAISNISSLGVVARTAANTFATRALTAPAAGITITNPDFLAANPTFALANDLAALEGLNGVGYAVRTGADTWAQRTLTGTARLTVTNGDGVAGNPTFDLATVTAGTGGNFLKFSQDIYGRVTATSAVVTSDLTPLLNTTYLGLAGGTMTGPLIGARDPQSALELATKQYVDTLVAGAGSAKPSVRALVRTNINIANPGTAVFDGFTASPTGTQGGPDRILLVGQTNAAQNGPWLFNGSGLALTRPADFDTSAEAVPGSTFCVTDGTADRLSVWSLITQSAITLGTTALTFTQTNGTADISASNGLAISGNTISAVLSARLAISGTNSIDLAPSGLAAGSYSYVTYDIYGRAVSGRAATPSDVGAQPVSNELTAVSNLNATGLVARTATGAYSPRTLTSGGAGISITNGDGVSGNPTISLSNDLASIENLAGFGFGARIAADTWAQRTITGTAGRIAVTNGAGTAADPAIDLVATGITPGTYQSVTVDAYGRATAGAVIVNAGTPGSALTNNEASPITICTAVYNDVANGMRRGNANNASTSLVVGLAFADVAVGASGIIATSGELTATTNQWDAVTGQTGGLTPNTRYFLDNVTAGHITSTMPSTGYLAPIGQAISTTRMVVRIGERIQL